MDFRAQRTEHTAAVPLGGGVAVGVVLRGGTGSGREFALDAVDRRAIHTDAVLRNPEDGLVARRARLCGQRETGTPELLRDSDVSAFEVYLLEEAYIKSILTKQTYHLSKAM